MTRTETRPEVLEAMEQIHPEVLRAMKAIELPEVQEMLQRLAKHGLAITVPHMHGEGGGFLPLPTGMVQVEDDLQVWFQAADDPELQGAIPVAWRCGWDDEKAAPTAKCVTRQCGLFTHHHHKVPK